MLKESNPVHRVNNIIRRLQVLAREMSPWYDAFDKLDPDAAGAFGSITVQYLESIPGFRTFWLEKQALDRELASLLLTMALKYEGINT